MAPVSIRLSGEDERSPCKGRQSQRREAQLLLRVFPPINTRCINRYIPVHGLWEHGFHSPHATAGSKLYVPYAVGTAISPGATGDHE